MSASFASAFDREQLMSLVPFNKGNEGRQNRLIGWKLERRGVCQGVINNEQQSG